MARSIWSATSSSSTITRRTKSGGRTMKTASLASWPPCTSLFPYFYKQELLTRNVAELVDFPTIHQKEIIRLETGEVARLLDEVESVSSSPTISSAITPTRSRDLAMISVFLGTRNSDQRVCRLECQRFGF